MECVLRVVWPAVDFMPDSLPLQEGKLRSPKQVLDLVEEVVKRSIRERYPEAGPIEVDSEQLFGNIPDIVKELRHRIRKMGGYMATCNDSQEIVLLDKLSKKMEACFEVWGKKNLGMPLRQPLGPCNDLECLRHLGHTILTELLGLRERITNEVPGRAVNSVMRKMVLLAMFGVSCSTLSNKSHVYTLTHNIN